jgi:hypothetical protein
MKRRRLPQFDLALHDEPFQLVGEDAPDPDRLRQEQEQRERDARERTTFEAQAQTKINLWD